MPGRYGHNPDPQLAELLHQVTMDGWGNDSCGDVDQDGFHARLLIVEPAEQSELTDAFDQPIPVGNWILTEDQQGFVSLAQYSTPQAARHAFMELPNLDGPGEETEPSRRRGRSAASTPSRSAAGSSATSRTWTRPPRCCKKPRLPTGTGLMPGSSATTAIPTA